MSSYTLYQKTQLLRFSDRLLRNAPGLRRNIKEARHLFDDFMTFRNRFWFAEVTKKPIGGEIYRKYQQGLETLPLYQAISSEVEDLHDYYEAKISSRITTLLNFLTFFFMPMAAITGFFGMNIFQVAKWEWFFWTLGITYLFSFTIWFLWTRVFPK